MDVDTAVELGREAILHGLLVSAPVLVTGLLAGLVIGLLQALTQVQEQTVSFVPKLVLMVLAVSLTLPWIIGVLVDYTRQLLSGIPEGW